MQQTQLWPAQTALARDYGVYDPVDDDDKDGVDESMEGGMGSLEDAPGSSTRHLVSSA